MKTSSSERPPLAMLTLIGRSFRRQGSISKRLRRETLLSRSEWGPYHVATFGIIWHNCGSSTPSTASSPPMSSPDSSAQHAAYWSKSLRIVLIILSIWAFISLGCAVLFREFLDSNLPSIGGAPFGFWMAQQGSIIGFVLLLITYMVMMNSLDRSHGFGEEEDV